MSANGASHLQSITLEFRVPQTLKQLSIRWEFEDREYESLIEGSDASGLGQSCTEVL